MCGGVTDELFTFALSSTSACKPARPAWRAPAVRPFQIHSLGMRQICCLYFAACPGTHLLCIRAAFSGSASVSRQADAGKAHVWRHGAAARSPHWRLQTSGRRHRQQQRPLKRQASSLLRPATVSGLLQRQAAPWPTQCQQQQSGAAETPAAALGGAALACNWRQRQNAPPTPAGAACRECCRQRRHQSGSSRRGRDSWPAWA